MALQFQGAPDWLLQEYMNRKSPGQEVIDTLQGAANTYLQVRKQQEDKALQQKALVSQEAAKNAAQFGAVAPYLPEEQIPAVAKQYGLNIPQSQPQLMGQAPMSNPMEEAAQQSLPSQHSMDSPIIQHWNAMQGGGMPQSRPTSKFGREQYAKDLGIQKTERDLATDPNAPVPVLSKSDALRAGQINPRAKIIDENAGMGLKPPTGFRYTADGSQLEAIPGGPADIKNQAIKEKEQGMLRSSIDLADRMIMKADEAMQKVSGTTAGLGGAWMSKIPGSSAVNLRKDIDTLKANLSFQTLQEMRRNSPTGGALGAISDRELTLLGSTVQSLDSEQSPTQLKQNLNKIKQHYTNWKRVAEQENPGMGQTAQTVSTGMEHMSEEELQRIVNGQ